MQKIKKDDMVIVIAGKDKGAKGKVLRVVDAGKKVYVEGVGMVKKHVKPNPNINEKGGIIEREMAIDISNVALYDKISAKPAKVGIRVLKDGEKARYFKRTNELVDSV